MGTLIQPLARAVEAEVCVDCKKFSRVYISPNVPEPDAPLVTLRPGEFHCIKDKCGRCWEYPYPLDTAAHEVETKPMLSADTQFVAAVTGLTIDIESQDEIRKVAGTCPACLFDVATILREKHKEPPAVEAAERRPKPWDILRDEVRDILDVVRKDMQIKHSKEHRVQRKSLYPRIIFHRVPMSPETTPSKPKKPANGNGNGKAAAYTVENPKNGNGKKAATNGGKAEEAVTSVIDKLNALEAAAKKAKEQMVGGRRYHGPDKLNAVLSYDIFCCPICESDKRFLEPGFNIHLSHCLGLDYPDLRKTKNKIKYWLWLLQEKDRRFTDAKGNQKRVVVLNSTDKVRVVPPKEKVPSPKKSLIKHIPSRKPAKRAATPAPCTRSKRARGKPIQMAPLDEEEESEESEEESSEESTDGDSFDSYDYESEGGTLRKYSDDESDYIGKPQR